MAALGYYLFVFFIAAIKLIKKGVEEHIKLQEISKKQMESELNLLKAQINPHFFLNTLNSLYALSLKESKDVPGVILKFSDLMKYILKNAPRNLVALSNEYDFIKSYIALEQIRFSKKCAISFNIKGELDGLNIAPMLLYPFIENSFKHGIGPSSARSFINIDLQVSENILNLQVENSIPENREGNENLSSETGIRNVRKRLDLLYNNRYTLDVTDKNNIFKVALTIEL
jgi:sensor histidine kinase YesM